MVLVAIGTKGVCQQIGDTTSVGVLGEGFAHLAHACPDVGSRVGVEECEIGEADISQGLWVAGWGFLLMDARVGVPQRQLQCQE